MGRPLRVDAPPFEVHWHRSARSERGDGARTHLLAAAHRQVTDIPKQGDVDADAGGRRR
jgi:hypothetical protein